MREFADVYIEWSQERPSPIHLDAEGSYSYRPHFQIGGGEYLGVSFLSGHPSVAVPGSDTTATVELIYADLGVDYSAIVEGADFDVLEGRTAVGNGRVIRRWSEPDLRPSQVHANAASSALFLLQSWFNAQCNGEWEHASGVSIQTLDNPGWLVAISLRETALESKQFVQSDESYDDEDEWLRCWVQDGQFHAACSPMKLERAIEIFIDWAGSTRKVE